MNTCSILVPWTDVKKQLGYPIYPNANLPKGKHKSKNKNTQYNFKLSAIFYVVKDLLLMYLTNFLITPFK